MIGRIQKSVFGTTRRGGRGYDEEEVDEFLDQITKGLSEGHLPDPHALRAAAFTLTRRWRPGYVTGDVHAFLSEIERYTTSGLAGDDTWAEAITSDPAPPRPRAESDPVLNAVRRTLLFLYSATIASVILAGLDVHTLRVVIGVSLAVWAIVPAATEWWRKRTLSTWSTWLSLPMAVLGCGTAADPARSWIAGIAAGSVIMAEIAFWAVRRRRIQMGQPAA